MKNFLKYLAPALVVALSLSIHAKADDKDKGKDKDKHAPKSAPEVDPSLAFGGLTLVGGTLTVLRSRRRK